MRPAFLPPQIPVPGTKVTLSMKDIVSPLKMAPATQTLEPLLPCGEASLLWAHPLLRVGLALVSTTLALTLPDFGFLVAFIGAFCSASAADRTRDLHEPQPLPAHCRLSPM